MERGYNAGIRPLERLSRLRDYTIGKHQVDPRGWSVVDEDGRDIGKVDDLLIERGQMAAAYFDLELDAKAFDGHRERHVIVPMSRARQDGGHRRLVVSGLTRERVGDLHEARAENEAQFWRRWWDQDDQAAGRPAWRTETGDGVRRDDLRTVLEDVRPGERVRIPVASEEIVIERRPVHPDERVVAQGGDLPQRAAEIGREADERLGAPDADRIPPDRRPERGR
jgi:hypothetical protein